MGTKLLPSVVVRVLTKDLLKMAPVEEQVEWLLRRGKMEPIAEAIRLFESAMKLCNEEEGYKEGFKEGIKEGNKEGHEGLGNVSLKLQQEVKMCLDLVKSALATANSVKTTQTLFASTLANGFDTTWFTTVHKFVPVVPVPKLLKEYRPLPRGTRIRMSDNLSVVLKAFEHMMVNWLERTMACCLGAEMFVMISNCNDEMYLAIPTIAYNNYNKMMHELMMDKDDETLQSRIQSTMKYGNWWPCGTFYLI